MLSKIGFTPPDVLAMTHHEVGLWIDSYLTSIGAKKRITVVSASESQKQEIRDRIAQEKAQQVANQTKT